MILLNPFLALVTYAAATYAPFGTPGNQQAAVVACSATAYTNDPDPKGMHIRSAANAKAPVVGTITDSDSQVAITGSAGDWLRIAQVRSADATVTFKGEGWVYAPLTAVRARGVAVLRAAPDRSGAAVSTLHDEDQLALLSCRGEWLRVKHKATTGWIEKSSQCGNPVTTCS